MRTHIKVFTQLSFEWREQSPIKTYPDHYSYSFNVHTVSSTIPGEGDSGRSITLTCPPDTEKELDAMISSHAPRFLNADSQTINSGVTGEKVIMYCFEVNPECRIDLHTEAVLVTQEF